MSNNSHDDLSTELKDYLKDELGRRFEELQRLLESIESDLRNGLISTGVFWSWLIANKDQLPDGNGEIAFLSSLILGVVLFFVIRWYVFKEAVWENVSYVKFIEDKLFGLVEDIKIKDHSWENYLENKRNEKAFKYIAFDIWGFFWFLLALLNIVFIIIWLVIVY